MVLIPIILVLNQECLKALFLVYINDLERNIKYNVKFFADDTMLFSIVKNPEISAISVGPSMEIRI
jgi:hypothetical protein